MLKDFWARPFTLDRIARLTLTLLLIVGLAYIVRSLSTILIPFGLAWLVAYMLMPVVRFFEKWLHIRQRWLSVVIIMLLLVLIVSGLILLLLPSIKEELSKGWEMLYFYATPDTLLAILPETLREQILQYTDIEKLLRDLDMDKLLSTTQEIASRGWSVVMSTFSFLMGFVVVFLFLLYLFFILADYERLNIGLVRLVPHAHRRSFLGLMRNVEYYVNSYFKGQALIALCVGILFSIGFRLIGLPMAISIGLLIGAFNLVPYLQTLGIIPLILASIIKAADSDQNFFVVFALCLGVLGVVQLIQDLVLTPRIHGKSMGMRPAVILLSLSVWGAVGGLLGMLFALPLTMICYIYYMKVVVGEPVENDASIRRRPSPPTPPSSQEQE